MGQPQISTTYERDRADDFDAVRRALTGRKFTAEHSLRLRDSIRLQSVPAASAKFLAYPPEREDETKWFERTKASMAGIHLSKEHVEELKRLLDCMEIRPYAEGTVPPLSEQPRDRLGYLEPAYRVPHGYSWTPETGCIPDPPETLENAPPGHRHCYLGDGKPDLFPVWKEL